MLPGKRKAKENGEAVKKQKTESKKENKQKPNKQQQEKDSDQPAELDAKEMELEEKKFKQLEEIQGDIDKLNEHANNEFFEIEKKYNKQRVPFYVKRDAVINSMDSFWLQCWLRSETLSNIIEEVDADILSHVTSLQVLENDDVKSGFKIVLKFRQNSFFSNKELFREYKYSDKNDVKVEASTIEWTDQTFPETKSESFFVSFFSNTEDPQEGIGQLIRDELYSNPVQVFLSPMPDEDDEEDIEELIGQDPLHGAADVDDGDADADGGETSDGASATTKDGAAGGADTTTPTTGATASTPGAPAAGPPQGAAKGKKGKKKKGKGQKPPQPKQAGQGQGQQKAAKQGQGQKGKKQKKP